MLKVNNIQVVYEPAILGVKSASLSLEKGQIVALLGPNGAGKSTTLKAISGLLSTERGRVQQGEIYYEDQRVDGKSPLEMGRLGVCHILEGREVFPSLSVEENLRTGTLMRRGNTAEMYAMVYHYFPILEKRKKQRAGYLSGGEQQMLAIARGLMTQPKLVLLDEPSLGLAPIVAKTVYEIVQKINQEQGTSFLIVEQNASLALSVADTVYVMTNGEIVYSGSVKETDLSHIRRLYLGEKVNEN